MAEPVIVKLSVTWDTTNGRMDFDIPQSPVIASGLLALLEAAIKIRVVGPAVMPTVTLAPGGAPPLPGLN